MTIWQWEVNSTLRRRKQGEQQEEKRIREGGKPAEKFFRGIYRAAVFCPGPKITIRKNCESFFLDPDKKIRFEKRKIRATEVFCPGPKITIRSRKRGCKSRIKNLGPGQKNTIPGTTKWTLPKWFVQVLKSRFVMAFTLANHESKVRDPDKKIRLIKWQRPTIRGVTYRIVISGHRRTSWIF